MAQMARALLPFAILPHTAAWHPTFQWVLDTFYYTTSSLPSADDSGSQLVPDPRIGRQGPNCLCDVTVGRCDTGCCCDSDCSYEAIRLGGYFGCTSNGTVVEISSFTTCSDQLVATNIPQHLEHSGVVRAFGGSNGLLCIERDNSPSRGTFYQGTGSKSPSQVEAMIDAQFGFYSTRQEASSQEVGRYELRAPVKGDGCISAASTDGCASIFDFQLPAVTPDGGCGGKQLRDARERLQHHTQRQLPVPNPDLQAALGQCASGCQVRHDWQLGAWLVACRIELRAGPVHERDGPLPVASHGQPLGRHRERDRVREF